LEKVEKGRKEQGKKEKGERNKEKGERRKEGITVLSPCSFLPSPFFLLFTGFVRK
jgi:hypothetical protein